MKRIIIIIGVLTMLLNEVKAQILHPVRWAYAAKITGKDEATILFKATIEESWHIYSIHQKDGGPVKTNFNFIPTNDYELVGGMTEPAPLTKYEKTFKMNVSFFKKSVVFQQKVKLKSINPIIKGSLNFMVCSENKCLPPEDVEFTIPIK